MLPDSAFTVNRLILGFLVVAASASISCCQKTVGQLMNERIVNPMSATETIEVFTITNRVTSSRIASCSSKYFQNNAGSRLQEAVCKVSVPLKHSVGSLDVSEDRSPDKDVYFLAGGYETKTDGAIYDKAKEAKEVILFVHGFNVDFDEALIRAAQIKYDVKYQNPIYLFTWPAGAADGLLSSLLMTQTYAKNQENAKKSIDSLVAVLRDFQSRGVKVNLIVHSMGHQVAIPAILSMVRGDGKTGFLNEVIFNAPDYASGEFAVAAADLLKSARRITVYCSPGDNALVASQQVNGNHRIGMCLKVDGVDMINVNEIDSPVLGIGGLGHGYYSGRPILVDLYQLLDGIDAEKRLFIRKSDSRFEHYVLRH